MASSAASPPPNHHADYPRCSGALGLLVGLTMCCGRAGDTRMAMRLTGAEAGQHAIDLGCGPGAAARFAARAGVQVTGVDPSGAMLSLARLSTRSSEVSYVQGTAEALPVSDRTASVLWTIASVHHWQDLDAGLTEIRRALSRGGRFVAIERHTRPAATGFASHGWTDGQASAFAELCREHGFSAITIERAKGAWRNLIAVLATAP